MNARERAQRAGRAGRAVYDLGAQDRGEPMDPDDVAAFTKRVGEIWRVPRPHQPAQLSATEQDAVDRAAARLSRGFEAQRRKYVSDYEDRLLFGRPPSYKPRLLADLTVYAYGYGAEKRPWVLPEDDGMLARLDVGPAERPAWRHKHEPLMVVRIGGNDRCSQGIGQPAMSDTSTEIKGPR